MKQLNLDISLRKKFFFTFLYLALNLAIFSCNYSEASPILDSQKSHKSSEIKLEQSMNSTKSTDISESEQDCELSGGEIVRNGWRGKDTGDNFCNNCFCQNGNLGCTKMFCNKKQQISTSNVIPTNIPVKISTPATTVQSATSGSYKLVSGSLSKSFASFVAVLLPAPINQDVRFKYKFIHTKNNEKPESINDFCDSPKSWYKIIDSMQNSVSVPQDSFPNEQGFIHLCVSYLSGYGKYSDWLRLNQTVEIVGSKKNESINMILCCNQYLTSANYKIKEQIKIPGKSDPITQYAIGVTNDLEGTIIFNSSGKIHPQYPSEIVVNLAALKSDSSLRDNYLKNNSLEINKYPELKLNITNVEGLNWPFEEGVMKEFKIFGDLEIHGVLRPSEWNVEAILEGGNITGKANTEFSFGDFDIEIPKIYVVYVEDKIELNINFSATYLE